jgi:hypothetical protein
MALRVDSRRDFGAVQHGAARSYSVLYSLFDHVVGDGEQFLRHVEAQRFGSLEIQHGSKFYAVIERR